ARTSPDAAVASASSEILARKRDSFRLALERGVRWGVGSDADMSADPSLLIDEAIYLVRHVGLTPAEGVAALTTGEAERLGLGEREDVTLFDGNPLQDIDALRRVAITVTRGAVHDWRGEAAHA